MNLLKLLPTSLKLWLLKHLYTDIAAKGRMGDTTLAHINTEEAALLKAQGGSGTVNPATGLFEYGKGGGSPAPAPDTKSYSSDLPEYAQPFYEELMKQSAKEVYTTDSEGNVTGVQGKPAYGGDRLAEFNADQTNVQAGIRGLTARPEFEEAITTTETIGGLGAGAAASGLGAASAFAPGAVADIGMATPAEFDGAAAAKYMSPYQSNVTDIQLAEARRQADIAKSGRGMGSIGRGTFGGGRQALMEGEADRNLAMQLGQIQATGSQDAYKNAQAQFQADQARQMQANQANLQADVAGRQLTQQGEQFGAGLQKDIGLAGMQYGLAGAAQQGALSTAEQKNNLERLQAQAASGAEQQALQQEIDNLAYQEFMEAEDYKKKQLEYQSNILRGTAGALGSTQTQYAAAPSLASQITGMGVAGLGLYNALK